MNNLISVLGFFCFILISWLLSFNRKKINYYPVIGGIILQFVFAAIIFCIPASREVFVIFSKLFSKLIIYSKEGIVFVFGSLGSDKSDVGFILAFQVLPFVIVFSGIISALYYFGIMQRVIRFFAIIFSKLLKTSAAETLCASANIFVGIESAITIRPYLKNMTRSELFVVLTAGMSTIASSMLAVYVSFLHKTFPLIAGHLLSASLISIPATFVVCKLIIPETQDPRTLDIAKCNLDSDAKSSNFVESILNGANNGAKMAVGIGVTLLAFIGILGIINGILGYFGIKFGVDLTLQNILSYVFYPFTWLMGINASDVSHISKLLGQRLIVTEIPAYLELSKLASNGLNPRTILIASYALCGFAHIASMAIFVGGIGALVPSRVSELTRLGPIALLAATIVTMMTGCIAGIFYFGQTGLLS